MARWYNSTGMAAKPEVGGMTAKTKEHAADMRLKKRLAKIVTTKKRVNTKVKKVKTPANKKKLKAIVLLIMLKRRPEIVAMGKAPQCDNYRFPPRQIC